MASMRPPRRRKERKRERRKGRGERRERDVKLCESCWELSAGRWTLVALGAAASGDWETLGAEAL